MIVKQNIVISASEVEPAAGGGRGWGAVEFLEMSSFNQPKPRYLRRAISARLPQPPRARTSARRSRPRSISSVVGQTLSVAILHPRSYETVPIFADCAAFFLL